VAKQCDGGFGWNSALQGAGDAPFPTLKVIGLDGCYHGDTLGAMDCQGPSAFTGDLQFPWYSGRGLWLDPAMFGQVSFSSWLSLFGHRC
jgi:dethiobiotin synthetase/adenosylmethionine--8-amino-7-oxononanoate aminotransferase